MTLKREAMKKIFLLITVSLLFSGNAFAVSTNILLKNENSIHIQTAKHSDKKTIDFNIQMQAAWNIGENHCSRLGKYAYLINTDYTGFFMPKINKHYSLKKHDVVLEIICSSNVLFSAPSFAKSGSKIEIGWCNNPANPECSVIASFENKKKALEKQEEIMFTIKDKREQCEAIGFKPETEKFADCVLRLVELDVKKQQSNKIAQAQQSGNDALVKQLQRQQYDRGTDALLNLGQQLLNPGTTNSNIYMPQTQRCTIQGFDSFAKMTCR